MSHCLLCSVNYNIYNTITPQKEYLLAMYINEFLIRLSLVIFAWRDAATFPHASDNRCNQNQREKHLREWPTHAVWVNVAYNVKALPALEQCHIRTVQMVKG